MELSWRTILLYVGIDEPRDFRYVRSEWAISDNNRRAKCYSLTAAGRKALAQEAAQWERLAGAITAIVRTV